MFNFSIIIPTKNQTTLLQRCLDSIPIRDDLEIIIVDDNSSPGIVDFGNYPGEGRTNVSIIYSKEGKGAGYARNIGVTKAKGKWLIFVDADDEVITQEFNNSLDRYLNSTFDIIYFDVRVVDSITGVELQNPIQYQRTIRTSAKNINNLCRYTLLVPWGKMIRRSLVISHQIYFDETLVANDAMFSLLTGYYANEVFVDTAQIYCWYTQNKGSITTMRDKDSIKIHVDCAIRRNKFMISRGIDEYRVNMFHYVPMMIRSGYTFRIAMNTVLKTVPKKYLVSDLFDAFVSYWKK